MIKHYTHSHLLYFTHAAAPRVRLDFININIIIIISCIITRMMMVVIGNAVVL